MLLCHHRPTDYQLCAMLNHLGHGSRLEPVVLCHGHEHDAARQVYAGNCVELIDGFTVHLPRIFGKY